MILKEGGEGEGEKSATTIICYKRDYRTQALCRRLAAYSYIYEFRVYRFFPKMCKVIMFIGTSKQYTFRTFNIICLKLYTVLHLKDDELTHF